MASRHSNINCLKEVDIRLYILVILWVEVKLNPLISKGKATGKPQFAIDIILSLE
jgi:hypothetical protein